MYHVLDLKVTFIKRGIFDGFISVGLRVVDRLLNKATSLSVYDIEFSGKAFLEVIENLTKESQPTASFCFILKSVSPMLVTAVGSMTGKPYNGRH